MKEVELVGTVEEAYEKLTTHVGQKVCQYSNGDRFESTVTEVSRIDGSYIIMNTDPFGQYDYRHGVAPPFFLCLEEDEVFETFDEMVKRKQEEMFKEKCY